MGRLHDLKNRFWVNGSFALVTALALATSQIRLLQLFFIFFIVLIAARALWEFSELASRKSVATPRALSLLFAALYIFASFTKAKFPSLWSENLPEIVLGAALFVYFLNFARKKSSSLAGIAISFFGLIYVAIPFGLIVRIAYLSKSPAANLFWLVYLVLVTKSADIGGYFFGKLMGKRKFAGYLSPSKTLEGAVGGLFTSTLFSLIFGIVAKRFDLIESTIPLVNFAWIGLLIGLFSELGDLAESLLKRDAKVKDSGSIPGVGGILDLVDSLLFTSPLLYILLKINAYGIGA